MIAGEASCGYRLSAYIFNKSMSHLPRLTSGYRCLLPSTESTDVKSKTLNPRWDSSFKVHLNAAEANSVIRSSKGDPRRRMELHIYDKDNHSKDDPMGVAYVPFTVTEPSGAHWCEVESGPVGSEWYCQDATGRLEVRTSASARRVLSLSRGNTLWIPPVSSLRIGLGWEMERGVAVDLDASCVAVGRTGSVLMDETVYYANLANSNHSVTHSGDEKEGDEDIGGTGDDEVIVANLSRVPDHVLALYFLLTVATPGKTLREIQSALVTVLDTVTGNRLCRFVPALSGDHTAMFLMRLARPGGGVGASSSWALSVIEDTDHTARDFGSLIPEIKGYCRDLIPGIVIDPNERVAIMQKGGTIRLRDYSPNRSDVPQTVMLGLAWDVTNGVNIDLDASAICLDVNLQLVDVIFFNKLTSEDGSIRHSGDEREGDEVGDDEKIAIDLAQVQPEVKYIGFVVTSYSGQELDDVARAGCHLFDPSNGRDIMKYGLSNARELDKRTALVLACLYRNDADRDSGEVGFGANWFLRIVSEATQGKTAYQVVDKLQAFLRRSPHQVPSPPP